MTQESLKISDFESYLKWHHCCDSSHTQPCVVWRKFTTGVNRWCSSFFSHLWAIPGFTQQNLILSLVVKLTLRSSIWFEKIRWCGLLKNIFIYLFMAYIHFLFVRKPGHLLLFLLEEGNSSPVERLWNNADILISFSMGKKKMIQSWSWQSWAQSKENIFLPTRNGKVACRLTTTGVAR